MCLPYFNIMQIKKIMSIFKIIENRKTPYISVGYEYLYENGENADGEIPHKYALKIKLIT